MNCVMKYLLTIFAAAMLYLSASAQDHLCFEGIPIEGPVSSFVDKLKEAGFKEWEDDIARTLLKGKLFGRECTLIVKSNPDNGDVYAVTATFAIRNNWKLCKEDYLAAQEGLTRQFGRPTRIEKFERPFREGDGLELHHLNMGLCKWISTYNTPCGPVTLRLAPVIVNNGQLVVLWEDKINSELMSAKMGE